MFLNEFFEKVNFENDNRWKKKYENDPVYKSMGENLNSDAELRRLN